MNIKGYDKLSKSAAKVFDLFIKNYMSATEDNILPVRVIEHRDHLKFYFKRNNEQEWIHVKGPSTWY